MTLIKSQYELACRYNRMCNEIRRLWDTASEDDYSANWQPVSDSPDVRWLTEYEECANELHDRVIDIPGWIQMKASQTVPTVIYLPYAFELDEAMEYEYEDAE